MAARNERRRLAGREEGISLIEIMVALTILTIVLMALGGLMFHVARQTQRSAVLTYQSAAVQRAAAWVEGIPWDSIGPVPAPGIIGCTSNSTGTMPYDQCVSVMDTTTLLKRVTVVITPTGNLTGRPDTIVVYRNRSRPSSPLN